MSGDTLADWMNASLDALEHDVPAHAAILAERLDTLAISLDVDGESAGLAVAGGRVRIGPVPTMPDVRVVTSRAALRDLLTGRRSTLTLLRTDTLLVAGSAAALRRAASAGEAWLHGHLRSARSAALLREFCAARQNGGIEST